MMAPYKSLQLTTLRDRKIKKETDRQLDMTFVRFSEWMDGFIDRQRIYSCIHKASQTFYTKINRRRRRSQFQITM